jgi:hypothetical protein
MYSLKKHRVLLSATSRTHQVHPGQAASHDDDNQGVLIKFYQITRALKVLKV